MELLLPTRRDQAETNRTAALCQMQPQDMAIMEIEVAGRVVRDDAGQILILEHCCNNAATAYDYNAMRTVLAKAMVRLLTNPQKVVLIAYYFERRTMPDIAKEMGICQSSAWRIHRRALKRLQEAEPLKQLYEEVAH